MKRSKASTRSSRKSKQDSNDYHQRIQNYKQDIDKIKSQVSQLQQKLDEQTDYDSTIDLTDDFFQDKYPTKSSKDIKPFSHEQHNTRKSKERLAKKNQGEILENEDFRKGSANIKTKSYQTRQISPITSVDHQKKKHHDDKKNDIETPSLENYNQILTDNKVLAHKIKNLLASNSNLDEENKSLKKSNENLNQQNQDLNEQLTNAKAKQAKLEKLTKELKAKINQQNQTKKNSSSKRSKSVNKIPVIIDPDQIKEKVNSRDIDVDKILSLENETSDPNKNSEEQKKDTETNSHLEKENKKLKEKVSILSDELKQNTKDFKNKIDKLTAENKELKDQLENPPKQLVETSSTKKLREADSIAIADLTDKIALLEEENRKLRTKGLSASSVNAENQDLKKQLNKKQRSRPTDNEAIASLTEKISDLTQENMNLKRSLISSRSLRNENDELKEKIEKLEKPNSKGIRSLYDSNLSENSSEDDLHEKVASLTKENNELKSLERENAKLQNKYNSLVEAIQKTKPDQTAKKQIEKLKQTIEALSKENNDPKSSSSLSPLRSTCRSVDFKENGTENNNENEIKRLNEELSSSKDVIDRMEKEFALQKKELKDNYDSLLKEITSDFQNKQSPKENQLNKKIKILEQDLDNQRRLYSSLENVNLKLQDQIAQSRANNLSLIKQIEEMNKQIEQLNGNTSSLQFSDQSDQERYKKNNEYDQIKTDFVQIHKALNEVPDSSDSYSTKLNRFKFASSQASSSSSKVKNNLKEAKEPKNQIEEHNKSSPSSNKKKNHNEYNDTKNQYPYQSLNNDIEDADDDDEGTDAFLNGNKEIILSDTGNDTDNDDINVFLNDNFTDSDTEIENKNTSINNNNKNSTLSDSNNSDNNKTNNTRISNNNSPTNNSRSPINKSPISNKSPKKKRSAASPVDLDALLDTSSAGFNGAFSTSEAFRQLVESIDQSRGEILMNTEEEYEKLKANLSLEDSLSQDEKNKNKEKSPKKGKKIEHLPLHDDLDDDNTFSG